MSDTIYQAILRLDGACVGVKTANDKLIGLDFLAMDMQQDCTNRLAEQVCQQLLRYSADPCFRFDVPMLLRGTPFQLRVWAELQCILPGQLLTYAALAGRVGSVARAVGQACGANPIPIIVPCHRVVSQSGLGGFNHEEDGEMLNIKQWLIGHEGRAVFSG
ncbi:methylated-DNA-[protein]-cysteine S-methyltransferase [Chitinivorax tropicus]|uniref:Methylated-DNA-[protein]-cysteine S-methyltransferase n=1 Tax=Chitinivorax tropicus TaxID=714531 RepID=A0A840MFE2_9PROT|nr:methylated-DNA--[protein]-cysteine S-methyltransferase [Chitinivorax tropicus]MBB5017388.1 methylated-DNA-[protein]-cysteine S-methyltransferase [Chitinivorax tropicus]